ncbi:MAG TPA: sensor domain-containing diguanylate cyclase [Bacillota bacterium]|nr:sensor domain-containing diguanylate cyclase [Bacillota bacterium]
MMIDAPYEKVLSSLTTLLNQTLHGIHAAVYLLDSKHDNYQLTAANKEVQNRFKTSVDKRVIETNPLEVIYAPAATLEADITPIPTNIGHSGFLVIISERKQRSAVILKILKHELEMFLQIAADYYSSIEKRKKNRFLFELTMRVHGTNNPKEILSELAVALEHLYPHYTYDFLLSHDYETENTLPVQTITYSVDTAEELSTKAFMSGEVQYEYLQDEKTVRLYSPLSGKQGVYGVLQMTARNQTAFSKAETAFITRLSSAAGQALERASLYRKSERLVDDLKRINDATRQLNLNLQSSEIMDILKDQLIAACHAKQIGFIQFEEGSFQSFEVLSQSTDFFMTDVGQAFVEYVVQQMKKRTEAIFTGNFQTDDGAFPYRSMVVIPIQQGEMTYGVVMILHEASYRFSLESFKLAQSLIQHSALALSNSILKSRLEHAAITDYLTKLYSRKYLDEKVACDMRKAEKGALVLFDIDDFKKVNDTYGHHVGDHVIIQVAEVIKHQLGPEEIAARWGGEELAVYLPQADMEHALQMAKKIRKCAGKKTNPRVTLSSGIATWSKDKQSSVRDLFIRADKALYKAKNSGKNRISIAGDRESE